MAYTLPELAYAYDALEPHIDTQTMQIHHTKHHQTYINNINAAIAGTDWEKLAVEALVAQVERVPEQLKATVINNAGGHANHSLFWTVMSPQGGGEPQAELAQAIQRDIGGLEAFKEAFTKAALTRFGSGWAWLVLEGGKLKITKTPNADTPMAHGQKAILTVDVWEHAYYLDYQNKRADYIDTFLKHLVNWDFANANLAS